MKKTYLLAITLIIIAFYFVFTNLRTEMAIIYFPIDYNSTFKYAKTSLVALDDHVTVDWTSKSESEAKNYLRQDVSLLFVNGKLSGVQNKWIENESLIEQSKQTLITTNALLQAISFHHAEIHENNSIYSMQTMSDDFLYIINHDSFHYPKTTKEIELSEKLTEQIERKLTKNWEQLMQYFAINQHDYILYSLTDIDNLASDLKESTSETISDRIIGQLWEGLYKNYIIQALEVKTNDYMPIILIAKDYSHLYVLYEMDEEKQQLIQQLNIND